MVLSTFGWFYVRHAMARLAGEPFGNETGSMAVPYPVFVEVIRLVALLLSLAAITFVFADLLAWMRTRTR